jgi:hypothetical protein
MNDNKYNIPEKNKCEIFKEFIYGGEIKHDVLESYYSKITKEYLIY